MATGDPDADAARAADDRGKGAWMADTALERLSGRAQGEAQPVEVSLVMSESAILPEDESEGPAPRQRPRRPAHRRRWHLGGIAEGRAEVSGWGPIPAETAREHLVRLLDTGTSVWLCRLWTTPDGRDLVAMDSQRRLFAGGLRRLIELRDGTCRVPWCDAPISQIDHVIPFARGGPTSASNGMGACQRHNLVKEEPGWAFEVVCPDSVQGPHEVTLRTPTGDEHSSVAPSVFGHGRDRAPTPDSFLERHLVDLLDAA